MVALLANIFTPEELRIFFLISFVFMVVVVWCILFFVWRYFNFLFCYYTTFLDKVLKKNHEGGIPHEFSYGWVKGVRLTPIPPVRREHEKKVDVPIDWSKK